MKAAFAERDITPEPGMERPGNYGKRFHDGTMHDPCKVRASVFDSGDECVALVGIDTVVLQAAWVREVRKEIAAGCGIRPEAVMIGASHSHSAGPLGMVQPGQFDHAAEWIRRLVHENSSAADPSYMERVRTETVAAVIEAHQRRADVRCGVGAGHEEEAVFNRRFRMKDGNTYTFPGHGNPDIIEPAGPIDPQVGVLGVWDLRGDLQGCVVNFACHGTTDPGGISADWIYYLEKTIRGALAPEAIVVFLQGACGDVSQVDQRGPHERQTGERWAHHVGGRVGAEAVKALVSMTVGDLAPVACRSRTLSLARRRPGTKRLRRAEEIARRDPAEIDATEFTFAREDVLLNAIVEKEPKAEVEVQAIQIGPAAFLANPAELLCQLGLDVRAGSRFPFTFPVSLANGRAGYVCPPREFDPGGGGYETRMTGYSNLEVDAGPKIVEALTGLASQLTPGKIPPSPEPPAFQGAWRYGNVPPEIR